jgi:putative colanic acid biosynthesis UDP-glucose lipid carrier transferase
MDGGVHSELDLPLSGGAHCTDKLKGALAGIIRFMIGHWARDQVIRLFDAAIWTVSAYTAAGIWFEWSLDGEHRIHLMLTYVFPLLAFMIFPAMGCYRSWRTLDYFSVVRPVFSASVLVGLSSLAITFMMHEIGALSRVWFMMTMLFVVGSTVSIRLAAVAMMKWFRLKGFDIRRILLIGNAKSVERMLKVVKKNPGFGYSVITTIQSDRKAARSGQKDCIDHSQVAIDGIAENNVDEVWITSSPENMENIGEVLAKLTQTAVSVRWLPDLNWLTILGSREESLMGEPSLLLNATAMDGGHGRLLKSVFDRLFALVVLLALLPVLLLIALLVKCSSPGPVIFRQVRQGVSGKPFKCLKFRTMVSHHEGSGIRQASVNDSRVTPLGRFLRRTSLDELPQFFNVLLGDMSVVGPRPHALQHNEFYSKQVDGYMQRYRTKPGITGWAQINGYRGETDTLGKMAKRVEYDIYYMKNWSFLLDIKIILATAFKGWVGSNAY